MQGFTIGLHKQLEYVKSILLQRNDKSFELSLNNSLFPGEPTAIDVYIHGVSSLFWASKKLQFPNEDEQKFSLSIEPESSISLMDQMVNLYKKANDAFTVYLESINEDDLEKKIPSPIGGDDMVLHDWLGINIHHTIGHVAQALRLQALYLRNKNEMKT